MNGRPWARSRSRIHAVASLVAFVLLALGAIIGCRPPLGAAVPASAPNDALTAAPPSMAVRTTMPSASAVADVPPAWVADLEGQLDCDGPMNPMGQEVPAELGPFGPAPTPERAIEGLLRIGNYAWLPAGGFDAPHVEDHWAVYRYLVEGSLKAIVVSTNHFVAVPDEIGWEIVALRACDPSEFDPADGLSGEPMTLWLDADCERVRADRIFSRPGPGHCGWEAVTFLEFEGSEYLRDVEGALDSHTEQPFRELARLPADAMDTGLHTPTLRLFTVPDGRVVYVRSNDGSVERWGRARETIGCM